MILLVSRHILHLSRSAPLALASSEIVHLFMNTNVHILSRYGAPEREFVRQFGQEVWDIKRTNVAWESSSTGHQPREANIGNCKFPREFCG